MGENGLEIMFGETVKKLVIEKSIEKRKNNTKNTSKNTAFGSAVRPHIMCECHNSVTDFNYII